MPEEKKHIWYVEALVLVPVVLHILATDEQEAFARANDGAWHNVIPDWNKSQVKGVGNFKEGPGVN